MLQCHVPQPVRVLYSKSMARMASLGRVYERPQLLPHYHMIRHARQPLHRGYASSFYCHTQREGRHLIARDARPLHACSFPWTSPCSPPLPSVSPRSSSMDADLQHKVAKAAHKAANHVCDLYWSVLQEMPQHRRDRRTSQIVPSAATYPKTVHVGYGEMTYLALDRLLLWLCHAAPSPTRLSSDSSFLDLGSGFAKVRHPRASSGTGASIGGHRVRPRETQQGVRRASISRGGQSAGLCRQTPSCCLTSLNITCSAEWS